MTPIQILLADDDEDDREFFCYAINKAGINADVTTVPDGQAFLRLISAKDYQPDIIFLDINMPKKNGIECLDAVRKLSGFASVPVLMFSTSAEDVHVDKAFALGANRYVRKPNSIKDQTELMKVIFSSGWKKDLYNIDRKHFLIQ